MPRPFVLVGLIALVLSGSAPALAADPLAVAYGTVAAAWRPALSPDGSKVVFLRMHQEDLPIAVVFDIEARKSRVIMASSKDEFDLNWCGWANEERLLCSLRAIHRDGHFLYPVGRLVAVNADGSEMKVLLERKLRGEFSQYQDQVIDWLVDDPKHVLIAMPGRRGRGVSRLDIYSGKTRRVERVRDGVWAWDSDGRGTPRLRYHQVRTESRWTYRNVGESDWHELHSSDITDFKDVFGPAGFGDDPNHLLVFDSHEGRVALFRETLGAERTSELVFSHSEVDVGAAFFLGKYRRVVAVGYATDRYHKHFFDAQVEKIAAEIETLLPGRSVAVIDESWDRNIYLAWAGSDVDAGAYYLYATDSKKLMRLAQRNPELAGMELAPMTPLRYAARDGTEIPAYLTRPVNTSTGPVPTVLLPHGGPQARDYHGFDWLVQFLAAHGYAVLQSNYRGSAGYGEEWVGDGAFRSWRLAINDVLDGADYLVEAGVADPDRICVVGWSYGGYAALLSAIEAPQKFRCVVSIAGVTDPWDLIDDRGGFLGRKATKEYVGTESEVLDRGSPIKRVAELQAPLLLFHGDEDVNVKVDHSRAMARAARAAKKSVTYVEYPEVAHGLFRNAHRIDMLDRIGQFLQANIGPASRAAAASAETTKSATSPPQ